MDGAKILTKGYTSAGVRIDGMENKLTVKSSEIYADGEEGTGLMTSYGI
jgi:hypothetical protein